MPSNLACIATTSVDVATKSVDVAMKFYVALIYVVGLTIHTIQFGFVMVNV